ncbi:MAG: type II toxin-antitoxin system VapC family toxin [Geminicoccaceae bacterium]
MFLLDTNVVSELRKVETGRADPIVVSWAVSQKAAEFFLSALSLMEIEIGVLRMERRDPDQGTRLRKWQEQRVLKEFAGRILPIDRAVALRCARLHVPDPRSERDALIAATALEHGLTVVTRNIRDFEASGVPLLDPWDVRK